MSSLLGGPRDRFPLSRAVDELSAAARWAGRPGLVWFAGIYYPSLFLNMVTLQTVVSLFERVLGRGLGLPLLSTDGEMMLPIAPQLPVRPQGPTELLVMTLLFLVPVIIMYRLNVGLALVSAPDVGAPSSADEESEDPSGRQRPRRSLAGVWRAGRGLTFNACGMWFTLLALLGAVMGFLFGPTVLVVQLLGLAHAPALLALVVLPVLVLVVGYFVVLQVLHQLALHSLVQNRRGVASALTHAWRLIRGEPWGAVRASLIDLLLSILVVAVKTAASIVLPLSLASGALGLVLQFVLLGATGAARASFWARAYRGLGGPLRSDNLPGLEPAGQLAAPPDPAHG
ncbi:MAG: hypothetical protein AAF682_05735 [Planctomycetota bacterium]